MRTARGTVIAATEGSFAGASRGSLSLHARNNILMKERPDSEVPTSGRAAELVASPPLVDRNFHPSPHGSGQAGKYGVGSPGAASHHHAALPCVYALSHPTQYRDSESARWSQPASVKLAKPTTARRGVAYERCVGCCRGSSLFSPAAPDRRCHNHCHHRYHRGCPTIAATTTSSYTGTGRLPRALLQLSLKNSEDGIARQRRSRYQDGVRVSDSGGERREGIEEVRVIAVARATLLSPAGLRDFPDIFPVNFPLLAGETRVRSRFFRLTRTASIYASGRIVVRCTGPRSKLQDFRPAGDVDDTGGLHRETKRIHVGLLSLLLGSFSYFSDFPPTRTPRSG